MASRFSSVPQETGVTVIFEQEITLGGYQVLYQKWHADDVAGDSVTFFNSDIGTLGEKEIEALVRTSSLLQKDSEIVVKRSARFTSVNFNMNKV